MAKKNDGGPAFAQPMVMGTIYTGMSLRDYFAGMVIQAFAMQQSENGWTAKGIAHDAYYVADAMLAERERD